MSRSSRSSAPWTNRATHFLRSCARARLTYVTGDTISDIPSGDKVGSGAYADLLASLVPGKNAAQRAALGRKGVSIGRLARTFGLQHLHAHFASDAATAALVASDVAGMPFSFTAHARDIFHCYVSRDVDDHARRLKIAAAAFVTTVSDFNRAYLQSLTGGRGGSNIIRLYNGIDLARFAPGRDGRRNRRSILSVGRLVEKKGLGDLVAACGILRERGVDFSCDIVGDGPLRGALETQITAAGLDAHVALRGALPHHEVREHMHGSGMMVLPCVVSSSGDQDGLPTVLLEALGIGLPAISTRIAGVPEIILDNVTGLLTEPAAPHGIAAAISRLLDDPALADRLATDGREHALRHFDLRTNVAALHQLFIRAGTVSSQHTEAPDAYRLSVS